MRQGEKLFELQSRIERLEAENRKLKEAQEIMAGHFVLPEPKPSKPDISKIVSESAERAKEAEDEYDRLVLERRIQDLERAR